MIEVFQPVFYVRVPLQARIRLRPKVRLLVGAAELNRNEMVDLAALGHVAVAMTLAAGNAIGFINGLLFVVRDVANALVVIGFADHRKADRLADSHFVAHQLRETCRGFLVWYGEKRTLALLFTAVPAAADDHQLPDKATRTMRRMGLTSRPGNASHKSIQKRLKLSDKVSGVFYNLFKKVSL